MQRTLNATKDWEGILDWDITTLVAVMVGSNYTSQLLVDIGDCKALPVKECLCCLREFRNRKYGHISKSYVPDNEFHSMKVLIMNSLRKLHEDIEEIAQRVVDGQHPLWEVAQRLHSTSDDLISAAQERTVSPSRTSTISEISTQESDAYEGRWNHLSKQMDEMSELLLDIKEQIRSDGEKTRAAISFESGSILSFLHSLRDDLSRRFEKLELTTVRMRGFIICAIQKEHATRSDYPVCPLL